MHTHLYVCMHVTIITQEEKDINLRVWGWVGQVQGRTAGRGWKEKRDRKTQCNCMSMKTY